MEMSENEFNERLLFYLNELKGVKLETDPKIAEYKKCLEDIIKMEPKKFEDIEINKEGNKNKFQDLFEEFDFRVEANGQSLGEYKKIEKKDNEKNITEFIWDDGDVVAFILAFVIVFGPILYGIPSTMSVAGPLLAYLSTKKFKRDKVIEKFGKR